MYAALIEVYLDGVERRSARRVRVRVRVFCCAMTMFGRVRVGVRAGVRVRVGVRVVVMVGLGLCLPRLADVELEARVLLVPRADHVRHLLPAQLRQACQQARRVPAGAPRRILLDAAAVAKATVHELVDARHADPAACGAVLLLLLRRRQVGQRDDAPRA